MGELQAGAAGDWEIVCTDGGGRRARIYPPVAGSMCSRCGERADDVSFLVEGAAGTEASGGFCDACLVLLLRECASDAG